MSDMPEKIIALKYSTGNTWDDYDKFTNQSNENTYIRADIVEKMLAGIKESLTTEISK